MKKPAKEWLPKPFQETYGKNLTHLIDGQPCDGIQLHRFKYDQSLRGAHILYCCDCGLAHLHTFEIYRDRNLMFWLNLRPFRLTGDTNEMRKKKRHLFIKRRGTK